MKTSIFDTGYAELQKQNYEAVSGYICPACQIENEIDAEYCDYCGEQILFSGDELYFEPAESVTPSLETIEF